MKRGNKPDEAIGPAIDGLELLKTIIPPEEEKEVADPLPAEEEPEPEIIEHPVVLLCGDGPVVDAVAALAESCGFLVEQAIGADGTACNDAGQVFQLENYDDFVTDCGVDRNYFVCVFLDDSGDCVNILRQCLDSEAAYIGLWANTDKKQEIYASLKEMGAPDAELVAMCCPIGLNIGANTPEQAAVGIVAELLAAKNGTLKRLDAEECYDGSARAGTRASQ